MLTPRGEAAQMAESATSKRGMGRKVQVALLRVRTGPECPKGNLRELTRDRQIGSLWNTPEAVLRVKFVVIQAYLKILYQHNLPSKEIKKRKKEKDEQSLKSGEGKK